MALVTGLVVAAGGVGAAVLTAPLASGAAAAGDTVVIDEQFNYEGAPDPALWELTTGTQYPGGPPNFGTGEQQTYTADPANIKVTGGNLVITPLRDGAGKWTSARAETKVRNLKPPQGQVMTSEANLQFPNVTGEKARGYWPAFWMLGGPYRDDRWSWPAVGEFDIAENVNGLNWSYSVLHCGYKAEWGGPCNEPNGINSGEKVCPGTSCQAGFHTYTFQWDRSTSPEELRWYLDGTETLKVKQSDIPADVWSSMTSHSGYYALFNVAIDGAFPVAKTGNSTAATEPGHPMLVNSFKVTYGAGGGGSVVTTTAPATSTAPTTTAAPGGGGSTPAEPTTSAPATTTAPGTGTCSPPSSGGDGGSATPTELTATKVTSSEIVLSWPAVPGAVRYGLLRAGVEIGTTAGTTISDGGLGPNLPYPHSIRAYAADGSVISTTKEVTTTTPA